MQVRSITTACKFVHAPMLLQDISMFSVFTLNIMLNLQSVPDLDLVFLSQFLIISYYLWLWKWWCSLWCKSQGYMQSILELFVFEQWNWFLPILKNIFQLHIDVCHFLKDVKFPGEHSRINLRWALKIGSNTATFLWNKIFRKKSNTLSRDNNSKKPQIF